MTVYIRGSDDFQAERMLEAGGVDSMAFLMHNSTTAAISPGSTLAGSNLYPAAISAYTSWGGISNGIALEDGSHSAGNYLGTSTMSGTWRCLGHSTAYTTTLFRYPMTVWVRIS